MTHCLTGLVKGYGDLRHINMLHLGASSRDIDTKQPHPIRKIESFARRGGSGPLSSSGVLHHANSGLTFLTVFSFDPNTVQ